MAGEDPEKAQKRRSAPASWCSQKSPCGHQRANGGDLFYAGTQANARTAEGDKKQNANGIASFRCSEEKSRIRAFDSLIFNSESLSSTDVASSRSCSSSFAPHVRSRGNTYFERGRVRIERRDARSLAAVVHGSRDEPYSVSLAWHVEGTVLGSLCECPHFASGELCKHVWAGILGAELDGWFTDASPSAHTDVVWDGAPENEDEHLQATPTTVQRRAGGQDWRHDLHAFANTAVPTNVPQRQIWLAIDKSVSQREQQLMLAYHTRKRLLNGAWGEAKRQALSQQDLAAFAEDDQHVLLEMMLALNASADQTDSPTVSAAPSNITVSSGPARFHRVRIAPALYQQLLPVLCASQRLVTVSGGSCRPVHWDDSTPWQCRLRVATDEEHQRWSFTAELVRENESIALTDTPLVLATGLVLVGDRLCALELHHNERPWIEALARQSIIHIPFSDRKPFLTLWWKAPHRPQTTLPQDLELERIRVKPTGCLRIVDPGQRSNQRLQAAVTFDYAGHRCRPGQVDTGIVSSEYDQVMLRDTDTERALVERLGELNLRSNNRTKHDPGEYSFTASRLIEIVTTLLEEGWQVSTSSGPLRSPGSTSLNIRSGTDWFDIEGGVAFEGTRASLPDLLRAARKGEWQVRLEDGTQGLLPKQWLAKFERLAGFGHPSETGVRFKRRQAPMLDALLSEHEATPDQTFVRWRNKLDAVATIGARRQPKTFEGKLRHYQEEGLGWLHYLRKIEFGGCLADDMGLGKTVQAIALLEHCRTRKLKEDEQRLPSIVVVPKSLVFNWIAEARTFAPHLRVLDYTGTARTALRNQIDDIDLLITTYGTLRQDIAYLKKREFEYAILDEAQAIKNPQSQTAKAARMLHARHKLAITGTPVENHLGEIWSLFEFLNPGLLGGLKNFNALIDSNSQMHSEHSTEWDIADGLRPFILRRTKEQVLKELPDKSEQTIHCALDEPQRKAYNELRDYYRDVVQSRIDEFGVAGSQMHVLEALLRLRQAACHLRLVDDSNPAASSKFEVLFEQLEDVLGSGHKALIFSQFTQLLGLLKSELDRRNVAYEYLDGSTRDREKCVQHFQNDPDCGLFLISIKAGGHGLNLTAADYVFILDPWWNPAVESQAIDRAHRIGQTRRVFAYRLIATDTVEEKIVALQQKKQKLADAILTENNATLRNLTSEDIALLLS